MRLFSGVRLVKSCQLMLVIGEIYIFLVYFFCQMQLGYKASR